MEKKKIALIEDEVFISDLYKLLLEKGGYTVLTAFDGEAGLNLVKDNNDLSLIYLDIMLPKMHGIDILRAIKQDSNLKKIPTVMLSNLGDEAIAKETLSLGARDYLKKVYITPQQLVLCANNYLQDPTYTFKYDKRR